MPLLDAVFARLYDPMMASVERRGLARERARLLAGLSGDVVELGAGTGLNLPHYPASARLTLTEPTPEMAARLRARVERERPGAEVLLAPAEQLPLEDASADAVVSTLVLCTVADPQRALSEVRRVLRPGGRLLLFEHVATQGAWGRVQQLFEPVQHFCARGCHLTRDTRGELERAGFDTREVRDAELPGSPPLLRRAIAGSARRP
ncbi:class I SAM-dependent methyltransferase [Aggregicoccus sp. 17bor-14]|uniref:class I SAM-dependent methyltransferase n=1 Tax=Myxococcaceae TaxID=31 RepID=UPI00129CEB89|nr:MULTISPECIES: class I SAM-dependent methyltransferase [Myxococcaceae]MBF5043559.1 class I SAM-dependent methyltransferase [Simulacricoccus sp. 17bor-14]MRI89318.1 class I SAM-dependent methyltransferase [Aggregicoccus sp. 17bor-14]